jgi:hypothetical protein
MKSPALNRILERTPLESLVALSISAFLRCDDTEIERIYGTLPSRSKASRHEFIIRHHAMTESILLWAIEYWRTAATAKTCLVAAIAPGTTQIDADVSAFMLNAHKAKLATLIEAMRRICADIGIDFEDVAAFTEVDTEIDANPIPKLIPEYVEMFGIAG